MYYAYKLNNANTRELNANIRYTTMKGHKKKYPKRILNMLFYRKFRFWWNQNYLYHFFSGFNPFWALNGHPIVFDVLDWCHHEKSTIHLWNVPNLLSFYSWERHLYFNTKLSIVHRAKITIDNGLAICLDFTAWTLVLNVLLFVWTLVIFVQKLTNVWTLSLAW